MRKLFGLLTFIILVFSAFVPMAAAQTTESAGCTATDGFFQSGTGPYSLGPNTYLAGEKVKFTFAGVAGSSFNLSVNGVPSGGAIVPPASVTYTIPTDGAYTFDITVTAGTVANSASANCSPPSETETGEAGEICHRPPGNPAAAHTLNVGASAVDAHLAHGDSLGACPAGVQTRYDNNSLGITIFIIYATGDIQIYGDCDEAGVCSEVSNSPITVIINFNIIVVGGDEGDDEGEFVDVEDPEDYDFELPDSDPSDATTVVIYYLHPDPSDASIGVFQINVYNNGVLVDDSILLFINTEGKIILWTSQNFWEQQLEAALSED